MTEEKFKLTEGILIASIPVVGYWCAFLYELGYINYFNIPMFFVEVGLVSTMIAIIAMLSVLIVIYFIADFFMPFLRALPARFKLVLFMSLFLVCLAMTFRNYTGISILLIALWGHTLIVPLITQRKTKGYLAKLDAEHKKELSVDTLMDIGVRKIGSKLFNFLFILYLISILAFFSGGFRARFQENFIVLSGTPELVVLKKYDSNFVAAHFDRSSKSVSTEYELLPVDKSLGRIKLERVGPLLPTGHK